ncbi:hypothetical protein SNF32_05095 [Enterococcus mundtii]|nr:hypothetical protein [Enterococcus mundtii]
MDKKLNQDLFRKKKQFLFVTLFSFVVVYVAFSQFVGFQFGAAIAAIPQSFVWLFTNFIPTENSIQSLPLILSKLLETVLLSITATMTATVFSLITAIIGSETTGLNKGTKTVARVFASFLEISRSWFGQWSYC